MAGAISCAVQILSFIFGLIAVSAVHYANRNSLRMRKKMEYLVQTLEQRARPTVVCFVVIWRLEQTPRRAALGVGTKRPSQL